MKDLTVVEAKFVQGKLEGKSNTQAAMDATGAKTKDVAKTQGHRLSTKVNVQQAIEKALDKYGATIDKHARNIGNAMDATKITILGKGDDAFAESLPDHTVRLAAGDRLVKLLGLDKPKEDDLPPPPVSNAELLEAIKNGNIEELQRIVFKKDDV